MPSSKIKAIRKIKNLSILPRWIIFLLDIAITIFSFILSFLIRVEFNFSALQSFNLLNNTLMMLAFVVPMFSLFRVYAGIIRFTGMQDAFRIFFVVLFANVGYLILDLFYFQWYALHLVPTSVLIINTLLSFILLSAYRVIIKYFFAYITTINSAKKRVAIFGAGDVGISTKRALEHDMTANVQMVLFF